MKYIVIKLLIGGLFSAFGQKDMNHPFTIEVQFGLNTLHIETNAPFDKTVSSSSSGLGATYYFSNFFYAQTGISVLEDVSLSNLSFDTFKIPLTVGATFKLDPTHYFLFGELGGTYRVVYNVVNNLQETSKAKNGVWGFQTRLGMQFQLSKKVYSKIAYDAEYGFESFSLPNNDTFTIDKVSSISLFFGYRF